MKLIERLKWDSEFFGYEIGKVNIDNIESFDFENFKKEAEQFQLVYVFSKIKLFYAELKLVDEKAVFIRDTVNIMPSESEFKISSFDEKIHDLEELIALSLKSGVYSRFNIDPNFKQDEYERLYRTWILNSANGKLAFDIFLAIQENQIMGFTTIAKKTNKLADIGLVAVHEEARGKGVATALIERALQEAYKRQYTNIQVVTQFNNVPAKKLYYKTNFELKDLTNIYHYWNL